MQRQCRSCETHHIALGGLSVCVSVPAAHGVRDHQAERRRLRRPPVCWLRWLLLRRAARGRRHVAIPCGQHSGGSAMNQDAAAAAKRATHALKSDMSSNVLSGCVRDVSIKSCGLHRSTAAASAASGCRAPPVAISLAKALRNDGSDTLRCIHSGLKAQFAGPRAVVLAATMAVEQACMRHRVSATPKSVQSDALYAVLTAFRRFQRANRSLVQLLMAL